MSYCCRYSMLRCNKDLPLITANAFGCLSVQGLKRVPNPAAKIIAFIMPPFSLMGFSNLLLPARGDTILFSPYTCFSNALPMHRPHTRCGAGHRYNQN